MRGADGPDLSARWGRSGPIRCLDMKKKTSILVFLAVGLGFLYLIFTDEGRVMGSNFADWIEDIVKF